LRHSWRLEAEAWNRSDLRKALDRSPSNVRGERRKSVAPSHFLDLVVVLADLVAAVSAATTAAAAAAEVLFNHWACFIYGERAAIELRPVQL
jgi:hypothetical protein